MSLHNDVMGVFMYVMFLDMYVCSVEYDRWTQDRQGGHSPPGTLTHLLWMTPTLSSD